MKFNGIFVLILWLLFHALAHADITDKKPKHTNFFKPSV